MDLGPDKNNKMPGNWNKNKFITQIICNNTTPLLKTKTYDIYHKVKALLKVNFNYITNLILKYE